MTDTLIIDVATGRLQLWQLHLRAPDLFDAYLLGYDAGIASMQDRLQQAEHDADRFYEFWTNPGRKLAEVRQRRIEQALNEADAARELHTEADVLVVAATAAIAPKRSAA